MPYYHHWFGHNSSSCVISRGAWSTSVDSWNRISSAKSSWAREEFSSNPARATDDITCGDVLFVAMLEPIGCRQRSRARSEWPADWSPSVTNANSEPSSLHYLHRSSSNYSSIEFNPTDRCCSVTVHYGSRKARIIAGDRSWIDQNFTEQYPSASWMEGEGGFHTGSANFLPRCQGDIHESRLNTRSILGDGHVNSLRGIIAVRDADRTEQRDIAGEEIRGMDRDRRELPDGIERELKTDGEIQRGLAFPADPIVT